MALAFSGVADAQVLTPGVWSRGSLAAGQSDRYEVAVKEHSYIYFSVAQRGIDVSIELIDPSEVVVAAADGPSGPRGIEVIAEVLPEAGRYTIVITSKALDGVGAYQIKLGALRQAAEGDHSRAKAEVTFARASQLVWIGSEDALNEAILVYSRTLPVWRSLSDHSSEAATLGQLSLANRRLGDLTEALRFNLEALAISQEHGSRREVASALSRHGELLRISGSLGDAREAWEDALGHWRLAENRFMEAEVLNNLGLVAGQLGKAEEQIDYYGQALSIAEELGDNLAVATTLVNLGLAHRERGDAVQGLAHLNQALKRLGKTHDSALAANALHGIGWTLASIGDLQPALDRYEESLAIFETLGDPLGLAMVEGHIGGVLHEMGRPKAALARFEMALGIYRETGTSASNEAIGTLNAIGRIQAELGREGDSLAALYQAVELAEKSGHVRWQAAVLDSLGIATTRFGRPAEATQALEAAIGLWHDTGHSLGEARSIGNLGAALRASGDLVAAKEQLGAALKLSRKIGDKRSEGTTRIELSRLARDQGDLEVARRHVESAIDLLEATRRSVLDDELRASFLAARAEAYELLIVVLMELHQSHPSGGFDRQAFAVSERSRARSLLDLLLEAAAGVRKDVAPALLERERTLRRQIGAREVHRTRMAESSRWEEAQAVGVQVEELLDEHRQVMGQIRSASPRFAGLESPRLLGARDVQRELDDRTVLLEYFLGERSSFGWAISRNSFTSFDLPPRAEIEQQVREVRDLLTTRGRSMLDEESMEKRYARIAEADDRYWDEAQWLSALLFAPSIAESTERLVVIPDGALSYLPFGALPLPGTREPLIERYEVVNAPSASVAAFLVKQAQPSYSLQVAILADPVYHGQDQRIAKPVATARSTERYYPRLRFSRREAEAIQSLVPEGQSWVALDFEANRGALETPEAQSARWLHVATHGIVDEEHPRLSGLVLSTFDEEGLPRDGYLRLQDIYSLDLDAELVVLSGCKTAIGQELRGEGLMALTRGFYYAGAERVIASLWDVTDKATLELMTRFYQELIGQSLSPEAALRQAQLSMWRDRQWSAPYYWPR